MSSEDDIRLRVFSGPHLGAEIVLPPGDHLLGGDDSCDIILTDHGLAARHAVIRVVSPTPKNEHGPDVRVAPVDSRVFLDGQPVDDREGAWAQGTGCLLGTTLLAWLPANQGPEAWHNVFETMSKPREQNPEAPNQPPTAPETTAGTSLDEPAPNDVGDNTPTAPPTPGASTRAKGFFRTVLRAAIVLLCLGALIVSYEFRPASTTVTARQLQKMLAENAFGTLTAEDGKAFLTIRGSVDSDAERARLLRLAQSLHVPIQLDIRVDTDRAEALAFAFNSLGLFPEIRKNPEANHQYTVRGYMLDRQVENAAFAAVLEDFQGQVPPDLSRDIIHADAVAKELGTLLTEVGMDSIRVDYHPGLITLSGALSENRRHILETAMTEIQQRLGGPIPFKILAAPRPGSTPPHAASAPVPSGHGPGLETTVVDTEVSGTDTSTAALRVTGVTLTPMRFISLATGERVFEGGVLPSGHTLEQIGHKELKLHKNGVVTIYRLRGTDE